MNTIKNYANSLHSFCMPKAAPQTKEMQFQQAISSGNAKEVNKIARANPIFIYSPLPNGELPLNFAVRTSLPIEAKELVTQKLIKRGACPYAHFDDQRLNAIATAYYKGDEKLLKHLIIQDIKQGPMAKTKFGKRVIGEAKNLSGPSIERLKTVLNKNSPFAVSNQDVAMFVCSIAWAISQHIPEGLVEPKILQLLQLASMSPLFLNRSSLFYSILALGCMNAVSLSENLAPVALFVNSALTLNLAYNTFKGLSTAWRNRSLNPYLAMRKAILVHAPKTVLCFNQFRNIGQQLNGYIPASLKERVSNFIDFKWPSLGFGSDAESYDCNQHTDDALKDCAFKAEKRELTCSDSSLEQECAKAQAIFAKGIEENFKPDYEDDFWQFQNFQRPDCTPLKDYNKVYCEGQLKRLNNWCSKDPSSEDCKLVKDTITNSLKDGFKPNLKGEIIREAIVNKLNANENCPKDETFTTCVEKAKDLKENLCNEKNIRSEECIKGFALFQRAMLIKKDEEKPYTFNVNLYPDESSITAWGKFINYFYNPTVS